MHVVEFPKLLAIGLLSRRHSPQNYRQWGQVAANPSRDLQKVALPPAIVGLPVPIWRPCITLRNPPTWEGVASRSTKKFTKTLKMVKHLALRSLFHRHWLLHWMKWPVVAEVERQNHRIPLKTEIHKDRTRRGISNNDTSSPHKSDHVHQVGVSNIQALGRNARHFSSAWPGHRCWWPNWKSSALGKWKADMPQASDIDIHHFTLKSSLANRLQ